jgi:uncharacterized protein YhhL (DUF1145 family)
MIWLVLFLIIAVLYPDDARSFVSVIGRVILLLMVVVMAIIAVGAFS